LKFNDHANSDILRDICLAMLFIVWFFLGVKLWQQINPVDQN